MNVVEKFFGISVSLILFFIFPIIWSQEQTMATNQSYLEIKVDEFVKEVCSKGYLDEKMYGTFMELVAGLGIALKCDLMHEKIVYEPIYGNEGVDGDIFEYKVDTFRNEILDHIYANRIFEMDMGDVFEVVIFDNDGNIVGKSGTVTGKVRIHSV